MRVLIVASSFAPVVGGAETYAYDVAGGLAARGHRVTVATDLPRGSSPGDTFADPEGVAVHRFAGYGGLLADPTKIRWEQMAFAVMPELAACAAGSRPDLVLSNSLDAALLGKVVALQRDLPWAAAFHEHAPEDEALGAGRLRLVYEVLDPSLVLAGSSMYAERARRWGPDLPIELIHHGVDTVAFGPGVDGSAVRRAYGFDEEDLVIVSAGRLKPRKGMRELVRAFELVRRRERRARLLIVGSTSSASDEYAENLERDIDRLGLRAAARIDRGVTIDRMPAVLAAADVVAQPSWEEGLGLSVLEAMSAARPTVTTDVVGIREILAGAGEVALVVPPRQHRPLADALSTLLGSPGLRARLGARARQHVVARFSRRQMLVETEAALLGLVESRDAKELTHA